MGLILQIFLALNIVYFLAMAIAHFFSLKYPILFIYYDTLFYSYQDKIIAFCAVNYAVLFLAAFNNRVVVPYAITALGVTVLGLSAINLSPDLALVLPSIVGPEGEGKQGSTIMYWAQTGLIALLTVVLTVLYSFDQKTSKLE